MDVRPNVADRVLGLSAVDTADALQSTKAGRAGVQLFINGVPRFARISASYIRLAEHSGSQRNEGRSDSRATLGRTSAEEPPALVARGRVLEGERLGVMTNQSSSNCESELRTYGRRPLIVVGLAVFCFSMPSQVGAQSSSYQVFETDLTKDTFRSSGEPQIAVNPKNPKQIAAIEQSFGTKEVPAYSLYDQGPEFWRHFSAGAKDPMKDPQWDQTGLPLISNDGGKTWIRSPLPQPSILKKADCDTSDRAIQWLPPVRTAPSTHRLKSS